jgi:pimeloyl-ACP methyl ester carboxylesterase
VGCGEESTEILASTIRDFAAAAGEPPVVIAYSRGGQFARATAVRHPELVRSLITLGSPLRGDMSEIHPLLRLQVYALGTIGTLGVPGVLRASCLWGTCCNQLRTDVTGTFPTEVPFISIYSRADEIVGWRDSLDPAARHHEVNTSHSGLVTNPDVFAAVAAELGTLLVESDPDGTVTAA